MATTKRICPDCGQSVDARGLRLHLINTHGWQPKAAIQGVRDALRVDVDPIEWARGHYQDSQLLAFLESYRGDARPDRIEAAIAALKARMGAK